MTLPQPLIEKEARLTAQVRGLKAELRKQEARAYSAVGELLQKAADIDPVGAYWTARWLLDQAHELPPTRRELAIQQLSPLLVTKPL